MTQGGLAIAVGLLVDASIIMVENILHRLAGVTARRERRERALAAAVEVARPIAFTTLIVIVVFLPLFGMSGIEGRMYQPLAAAVIAAMVAALILALTLVPMALGSAAEAVMILATVPIAFVGGIFALLLAGETWNVSSLVGLIGLFGIAVQNSLVLVTQTRGLLAEGRSLRDAVREASIGRVRPKLMTAGTATLGLLPLLVLQLHGTEIERPFAVVMIGGLVTSTLFTLLVLPTFYLQVHGWLERR
jgi:cobalt-zinc-cadmium resistance protein CzcA